MKRILTIVSVLSLVLASGAMAEQYGWSVSSSTTDSHVNTGTSAGPSTVQNTYIWLQCVDPLGAAAAEFALSSTFAFAAGLPTTYNGVLATGSPDLLLAIPCATTETLCYGQAWFDATGLGGEVCLVNSANQGPPKNVTVDCRLVGALEFPNAITGFSSAGTTPCSVGSCVPTSVEDSSWGSIKGLYR